MFFSRTCKATIKQKKNTGQESLIYPTCVAFSPVAAKINEMMLSLGQLYQLAIPVLYMVYTHELDELLKQQRAKNIKLSRISYVNKIKEKYDVYSSANLLKTIWHVCPHHNCYSVSAYL